MFQNLGIQFIKCSLKTGKKIRIEIADKFCSIQIYYTFSYVHESIKMHRFNDVAFSCLTLSSLALEEIDKLVSDMHMILHNYVYVHVNCKFRK